MRLITEVSTFILRRQAVIITRELLQLVPKLQILPILPTYHPEILALQVLQALLSDLVRIQINHLIIFRKQVL